jgi:hypothetical protein
MAAIKPRWGSLFTPPSTIINLESTSESIIQVQLLIQNPIYKPHINLIPHESYPDSAKSCSPPVLPRPQRNNLDPRILHTSWFLLVTFAKVVPAGKPDDGPVRCLLIGDEREKRAMSVESRRRDAMLENGLELPA